MKSSKLNDHKLAQILLLAPLSAIHHKHSTIKEAILEMNSSSENSLEMEYVKDIFFLNAEEFADKWYEGKDDIVGFFLEKE